MRRDKHGLHLMVIHAQGHFQRTQPWWIELEFSDLMIGIAHPDDMLAKRIAPIAAAHFRRQGRGGDGSWRA